MVSAESFTWSPWIGSKTRQAESLTVEAAQLVSMIEIINNTLASKFGLFGIFQYPVYVFRSFLLRAR